MERSERRGTGLPDDEGLGGDSTSAAVEHLPIERLLELLPLPAADANKYSRGHALVVAGSRRYPGAAILSGLAATRAGAGYVTIAVPDGIAMLVRNHVIAAPVMGVPEDATGAFDGVAECGLSETVSRCDAVAVGPGITVTDGTDGLVRAIVYACDAPLVLDADAINIIAGETELLPRRASRGVATVLTPHEGERRRLLAALGIEVGHRDFEDTTRRLSDDKLLSGRLGVVLVDKGPVTYVVDADRVIRYSDGPPSLATSGTGDVLTGVITSLLACGLPPTDAAALGVHLHGSAARVATAARTMMCMTAPDLIEALPDAVSELISQGGTQ